MIWRCLLAILSLTSFAHAKPLDLELDAPSALLINAESGAILYEKNAHVSRFPASTIKIATALYALERKGDRLDEMVTADAESLRTIAPSKKRQGNYKMPSYWLETDASRSNIKVGERLSLRDLLHCHLIRSAGDASNVIAKHVSGSIPRFIDELNAYLKSLGLKDTHVMNPNGLHHPDQVTTAYDLALLTRKALQHPEFAAIVRKASYTVPETNKSPPRQLLQSNRLLRKGQHFYAKAIGVKTGYMSHARYNLVAAAEDKGRTLIAVVLKEETTHDRFRDSIRLFNAAYKEKQLRQRVLKKGAQNLYHQLPGANRQLQASVPDDVFLEYYPAEQSQVHAKVVWHDLDFPVAQGQHVAELQLANENGYVLKAVPLYAAAAVNGSVWHRLTHITEQPLELILGAIAVLLLLLAALLQKRKSVRP